jgi:uncharacterized RDD family membrane protein YckC
MSRAAEPVYAGFWLRAVALSIDELICAFITAVFSLPFMAFSEYSIASAYEDMMTLSVDSSLGYSFGAFITWFYFTLLESSKWQATLGKKMVGIKVTDTEGYQIGILQANIRYWSKFISAFILFFGYLMAALTEKKQALHDKIAGTLVILE